MVGRRTTIKVYSLQITGTFCRVCGWQGAAIKVYSLQVTGIFCRSYGWQEDSNKSVQPTGNRNILQELWLAGG